MLLLVMYDRITNNNNTYHYIHMIKSIHDHHDHINSFRNGKYIYFPLFRNQITLNKNNYTYKSTNHVSDQII